MYPHTEAIVRKDDVEHAQHRPFSIQKNLSASLVSLLQVFDAQFGVSVFPGGFKFALHELRGDGFVLRF